MVGIKESDTGLSIPSTWDLVADQKLASVIEYINLLGTSIDSSKMHKNIQIKSSIKRSLYDHY